MKYYYIIFFFLIRISITAQINVPNVVIDSLGEGSECTIIINRQSPSHILAAFNPPLGNGSNNPIIMYRSADAGLTWTQVDINSYFSFNYASWDPAFASDNAGRFYFMISDSIYKMHSFVSTDYGATWNTETIVPDADKEWIVTDNIPSSNYNGNLYCAYRRLSKTLGKECLLVTRSTDNGVSWDLPPDTLDVELSTNGMTPTGAGIAIGPAGEVNVSWAGGTPNQIHFKKSVDGATTWPISPTIIDNNLMPQNQFFIQLYDIVLIEAAWTSLACDVSGGPHNGNLYCVWTDMRNGGWSGFGYNADIYMGRSTDGGITWTSQRINNDLTIKNQVHPTVAVDPTSGWVYVSYMDGRDDLSNPSVSDSANYYLAYSSDGGVNFNNVKISQKPSVIPGGMEDDYYGIDAYGGKAHLIWASKDALSNTRKIMTACVTQAALQALNVEANEKPSSIILYPLFPNPFIDLITFDFKLPETAAVTITISDMKGNVVACPIKEKKYNQGTHRLEFDNLSLSAGVYIVTLATPNDKVFRKMAVVK